MDDAASDTSAEGLLLQLAGELGAALENGVRMVVYAPPLLGERERRLPERTSSGTPMSFSSARMWPLTVDCAR